jgi:hypothetical protein
MHAVIGLRHNECRKSKSNSSHCRFNMGFHGIFLSVSEEKKQSGNWTDAIFSG